MAAQLTLSGTPTNEKVRRKSYSREYQLEVATFYAPIGNDSPINNRCELINPTIRYFIMEGTSIKSLVILIRLINVTDLKITADPWLFSVPNSLLFPHVVGCLGQSIL